MQNAKGAKFSAKAAKFSFAVLCVFLCALCVKVESHQKHLSHKEPLKYLFGFIGSPIFANSHSIAAGNQC